MHASGETKRATCCGKTRFCDGKPVRVVEKKQLATCSGKLCLMHAVEKRDTQLVVGKLHFAVENIRNLSY
jgi:hypothetical protein